MDSGLPIQQNSVDQWKIKKPNIFTDMDTFHKQCEWKMLWKDIHMILFSICWNEK